MKRFIYKICYFLGVLGIILLLFVITPGTPRSKNNYLASKSLKDSLLDNVPNPRIIFVGGSNLVFGLNSQMVKDSLKINPINDGLAISLGLIYMMDAVAPKVRKGDIVVLVPEYQLYFGRYGYGLQDFFRYLKDNDPSGFNLLRMQHLPVLLMKGVPRYVKSKFDYRNYVYDTEGDYRGKHVINEYGESDFHWKLGNREFNLILPIKDNINYKTIGEIKKFESKINKSGGRLMIAFPGLQLNSYDVIKDKVNEIYETLQKENFVILGSPERYTFPDSLMFDSPYHLTKEGVDLRTKYLIDDIINAQNSLDKSSERLDSNF
jgi:hypothetical protein